MILFVVTVLQYVNSERAEELLPLQYWTYHLLSSAQNNLIS